jgi:hypothetical protein
MNYIRVELGPELENRGTWDYTVPAYGLSGRSHQPLLDACRQIKPLCDDTAMLAGLFRKGSSTPDLSCSVETGADTTVEETANGPRFRKYRPFSGRRP